MYIRNKCASVIFKFTALLTGLFGIIMKCVAYGGINFTLFNYYTFVSNAVCMIYFISAIIFCIATCNKPVYSFIPKLKGAVVMCITLTLVIFHFMLANTLFTMDGSPNSFGNVMLHYVVPIMTILDWLLFDKKGSFNKLCPILWTVLPILYLAYAMIASQFGNGIGWNCRYPYPFLDVDTLGIKIVSLIILALAAAYILLGYIFYFIDRLLSKANKTQIQTS